MSIDLDEVVQKFKEDRGEHPTSWYLGIRREDFRDVANELVKDLEEVGADLDWWLGNASMTGVGIIQLGPNPPEGSASIEHIVQKLGFNYEIMMKNVNGKLEENLNIIAGGLGLNGEMLRATIGEFGAEELRAQVGDIPKEVRERTFQTIVKGITELKKLDPKDKPLWVAKTLKEHGYSRVTIKEWFYCDVLFGRILKAETAKFLQTVLGGG